MDKPKEAKQEEIGQMFCSHCGDTKTYLKTDPRTTPVSCKVCLQGEMIKIVG